MAGTGRVLVTGSRDWRQVDILHNALRLAAVQLAGEAGIENAPTLVSGDCPTGADAQAEYVWESWGLEVERHPAQWKTHTDECPSWHAGMKVCKSAGFRRNTEMVQSLDPTRDIVVAFIRNHSKGASDTYDSAVAAGLRVWLYVDDEKETENDTPTE